VRTSRASLVVGRGGRAVQCARYSTPTPARRQQPLLNTGAEVFNGLVSLSSRCGCAARRLSWNSRPRWYMRVPEVARSADDAQTYRWISPPQPSRALAGGVVLFLVVATIFAALLCSTRHARRGGRQTTACHRCRCPPPAAAMRAHVSGGFDESAQCYGVRVRRRHTRITVVTACSRKPAWHGTPRHGRTRKATSLLPVTWHPTGPTPTTTNAKQAHVQRLLSLDRTSPSARAS
jgi:hypothetical protein